MELKKNRFKAAIKNNELQLGIWSSLCSPMGAEILGGADFDWILFDAEHSPVEIAGLYPLLQAAQSDTTHSIVRPAWNDKVLIKKVLDIGAQTVLIPYVQSAAEAADAVKSCSYPPQGVRGVAGATRASGYGRTKNYHKGAGEEICILVQVETGEALAELKEIAETLGVDGVFIGPSDLSASLGHLGNPSHPDVQDAIRDAVATIKAAGKAPGILAVNPVDAKRYIDWGYVFVACGVDVGLLVKSVDQLRRDMGDNS